MRTIGWLIVVGLVFALSVEIGAIIALLLQSR